VAVSMYYLKKYCVECAKQTNYLMSNSIHVTQKRFGTGNSANPMQSNEAIQLARTVHEIISCHKAKDTKRVIVDKKLSDKDIKKLIVGRGQTLRSPTLVYGSTLVVGFDQAVNEELFFGVAKK